MGIDGVTLGRDGRGRRQRLAGVGPGRPRVAIGTGTDVAIEAFDITLLNSRLDWGATSIRLSRRTFRTIQQNLGWAFGYNLAALPLAALGLLNPVIAAAAMGISSVSVVRGSWGATPPDRSFSTVCSGPGSLRRRRWVRGLSGACTTP